MAPYLATVIGILLLVSSAFPQPHAQAFEVASVRPAPSYSPGVDYRARGGPGTNDPGQVNYPRTFLLSLIREAYGVRSDQISGPDWLRSEPYTIVAKIPPNTTKDQFNVMLQKLLAERFRLAFHHETKDFPVYVLTVAEGGPKLQPSPPEREAPAAPSMAAGQKGGENPFPTLPPGLTRASSFRGGTAYFTFRETMPEFAEGLGALVNLSNGESVVRGGPPPPRVVDETGLTGRFDFNLEFAGSITLPQSMVQVEGGGEPAPASTPSGGPSLFSALQKQLGLKLEGGKRAMDLLVIDHVDKVPTEN